MKKNASDRPSCAKAAKAVHAMRSSLFAMGPRTVGYLKTYFTGPWDRLNNVSQQLTLPFKD